MTELTTKAFGVIEVSPKQIIEFDDGLYGFADYSEFALIEDKEESPFKWLQSTRDESLAFVLIQPELFMTEEYVPDVTKNDLEALSISNVREALLFLIVTIPETDPAGMTANLQGPVLINAEKKIGRQVISNNDNHAVRVSIMDSMEG